MIRKSILFFSLNDTGVQSSYYTLIIYVVFILSFSFCGFLYSLYIRREEFQKLKTKREIFSYVLTKWLEYPVFVSRFLLNKIVQTPLIDQWILKPLNRLYHKTPFPRDLEIIRSPKYTIEFVPPFLKDWAKIHPYFVRFLGITFTISPFITFYSRGVDPESQPFLYKLLTLFQYIKVPVFFVVFIVSIISLVYILPQYKKIWVDNPGVRPTATAMQTIWYCVGSACATIGVTSGAVSLLLWGDDMQIEARKHCPADKDPVKEYPTYFRDWVLRRRGLDPNYENPHMNSDASTAPQGRYQPPAGRTMAERELNASKRGF